VWYEPAAAVEHRLGPDRLNKRFFDTPRLGSTSSLAPGRTFVEPTPQARKMLRRRAVVDDKHLVPRLGLPDDRLEGSLRRSGTVRGRLGLLHPSLRPSKPIVPPLR
jgi:hypothetical protein